MKHKVSEETKIKISLSLKNNKNKKGSSKKVKCIETNETFDNQTLAEEYYELTNRSICDYFNERRNINGIYSNKLNKKINFIRI